MRAMSPLILAMISFGVPLGANRAYQLDSSTKPMPSSLKVGMSGSCAARARPDTAKARILPPWMLPMAPPSVVIQSEMRPEIISVTA